MDLHERYVHFPTVDLSILELLETAFKDDPFLLLHRLIRYYGTEIMKNNLDAKKLETFRMVLCYEYQLLFAYEKRYARTAAKDMCFKRIENILFPEKRLQCITQLPVLYDIVLLHVTLYCNPQCVKQHLINFQNSMDICSMSTNETRVFYMKIMECFLESLHLRQFLYNDKDLQSYKQLSLLYLKDIILWLEIKENKEWQSFASIFPKLVNTFGPEEVLPTVWETVLNTLKDLKDLFAALSIMVDTCFPLNAKDVLPIHYTMCNTEQLWSLLIKGLKSSVQQYRKQALFVMRRVTDFMSKMDTNNVKLKKPAVVPFVCNPSIKTELSINIIKEKFVLVLEALEEKQYHLVAPALTHVSSLIKGNQEHATCNDCFNIVWIQLIFERILQHENNTIVKQGILHACKLDTVIYDHQFLKLFVNVLNNTFLYEYPFHEDEPEILNDITTLFVRGEQEKSDFIAVLLTIISEVTWGPIPIFYMMKTLKMVSNKTSSLWKDNELNIVKSLVQKNLNVHSRILRIASQIELLNIIPNYLRKINNLTLLVNTLFEFPSEEALERGTFSWKVITEWLREVLTEADAINFIRVTSEKYILQNAHSDISPKKFAFAIFMLHDAGLILRHKTCPAEEILNSWLLSLNGVDMRPYADIMFNINTTEFMSHLLNLNIKVPSESFIRLLSLYIDDALKFLHKNMRSISSKLNYEDVNRYMSMVVSFLNNAYLLKPKKQIISYVEKFLSESICIFENINQYQNMHCLCALHILHFCQNILNTISTSLYVRPLLNIFKIQISDDNNEKGIISKGKIASDYYLLLAKLTHQYITKVPTETWPKEIDWFQNIYHLYEMGGKEVVPMIASILKTIVDKKAIQKSSDRSNLESIFITCWRCTFLSKKNKLYFMAIRNLTGVIINSNFLILPDAMSFISQFLDQLLEEGDNIPKLKKILLVEMETLDMYNLKNLQEALLSCLLHGYVPRRDQKIENQACFYIGKNYKQCYPQHISIIDHNNDATVRALSTVLLHKIINADSEYASLFLPLVFKKLEKYKNKRYFHHSYIHKIKHRIMQILLVLQPTLNENATATLQEILSNLILLESNQHSVRLMQEWVLIRIFLENSILHDRLWKFFEEGIETRPGCTSSIATIVYHVAKLISGDVQINFIRTAIKYIAQCCLGQQFSMRLYNQVIFVKLYKLLENLNCNHITSEYRGLYNAAVKSLKDGNLMKNSNRIEDDFYLCIFHPINDYSLQTIYFELPRLSDMDTDEWITADLFQILNFKENAKHPLQLYNLNALLSEVKTSSYLVKSSIADAKLLKNNIEMNLDGLSDIQKKIDPSISVNPLLKDIFPTVRESISHKKVLPDKGGIIIVASLIDRLPNLGGIARTCEIFSVKELIIANLNHIRDKDFQSLSVSAEKWITITEVKPHQLQEYLLEKKNVGWCLVGAEQTANSINLLDMKFNKKTILVLGNEKDGIPANLIPLFDTCIEIPQAGVIRSLNVHVTGAICIWQYAKQHILM